MPLVRCGRGVPNASNRGINPHWDAPVSPRPIPAASIKDLREETPSDWSGGSPGNPAIERKYHSHGVKFMSAKPKKKHGGARPGAGRPPGKPNKATQERQKQAAEKGPLPFDVMIYAMHYFLKEHQIAREIGDIETAVQMLIKAGAFAIAAAPYVHPKLSPISNDQHLAQEREKEEQPVADTTDYSSLSDEELDKLYREELDPYRH